ncbi:response regulator transcription factor [Cellulomonas sp.]|uniref:response regulator n=1 Tax=Cellulomonas sp. TaxID=40001 RepID=UPI001B08FE52|nr:response regulator transcription factor [Cellulomonas sp.]MBO9553991.1 response regulator transcription factor [Cellulomonas sp.]
MIRVLVADDQDLIRAGFAALVGTADDMEVVGEAADGAAAVEAARALRPDVVLMDVRMPGLDGIAATEQIAADADLADVKVVVLTTFEMDEYVLAALRAGASGFLGKGVRPAALLDGIRTVAAGESLLSPVATRALIAHLLDRATPTTVDTSALHDLTPREQEVVALVAQGLSNEQIAAQLYLSPLTAKTHVNRAMTKLGARDRAQLVVFAYQAGLGAD